MRGDIIISKGIYSHPEADGFIKAQQYIFLLRNGKRFLILRLLNETDATLDTVEAVITELDSHRRELGRHRVRFDKLSAEPGELFTPRGGIEVSSDCTDFKISYVKATSGDYTYRVKGRGISIYYKTDDEIRYAMPKAAPVFRASCRRPLRAPGAAALAVLLILLAVAGRLGLGFAGHYLEGAVEQLGEKIEESIDNFERDIEEWQKEREEQKNQRR